MIRHSQLIKARLVEKTLILHRLELQICVCNRPEPIGVRPVRPTGGPPYFGIGLYVYTTKKTSLALGLEASPCVLGNEKRLASVGPSTFHATEANSNSRLASFGNRYKRSIRTRSPGDERATRCAEGKETHR
jgi:hypothetical protein